MDTEKGESIVTEKDVQMSIEDGVAALIIEKVRRLRPEQQEEVLRFIESLEHGAAEARPRRSVQALWADLDIDLTEEDLATARKEMWGAFPIVRDPKMHGGRPTIAGTGVTVRAVAGLYKLGLNAEEIAGETSLQLAQVYAALAYYHSYTGEIEGDIEADSEAALREKYRAG